MFTPVPPKTLRRYYIVPSFGYHFGEYRIGFYQYHGVDWYLSRQFWYIYWNCLERRSEERRVGKECRP